MTIRPELLEDASRALTTWKALADSFRPAFDQAARTFQRFEQMKALILTAHGHDLASVASLAAPRPVIGEPAHVDECPVTPREMDEVAANQTSISIMPVREASDVSLARRLAERLRVDPRARRMDLAIEFRSTFEDLGHLEPDSTRETAKRRLQQFLNEHVYGELIPVEELPPAVRRGVRTGGVRDTNQP